MKAIELNRNFIFKEKRRDVLRDQDAFYVEMLLEPKYGTTFSQDLAEKINTFIMAIDKKTRSGSWASLKDTSRDELMQLLYDDLIRFYDIYLLMMKWEEKTAEERGYRAITQKTVDGEEYTIHEINPNPHALKLQREQFKSHFSGYWDQMLGHIYTKLEIRSLDEIKLVEL